MGNHFYNADGNPNWCNHLGGSLAVCNKLLFENCFICCPVLDFQTLHLVRVNIFSILNGREEKELS